MTRLPIAGTFLLVALSLGACQTGTEQAEAGDPAGACRPESAQALAGRDQVSDDEAKALTGATLVRQLKPGDAATADYRRERVTIETDPTTGKIVRASCG